jgi:enoyl-CoA hydratase
VVEPDALTTHALAAAQTLARLPPATFALTKGQLRQGLIDRMAKDGARVDALAGQIWTAPETLEHVKGFVAQTLKKA